MAFELVLLPSPPNPGGHTWAAVSGAVRVTAPSVKSLTRLPFLRAALAYFLGGSFLLRNGGEAHPPGSVALSLEEESEMTLPFYRHRH